jgi:hypothetical protein
MDLGAVGCLWLKFSADYMYKVQSISFGKIPNPKAFLPSQKTVFSKKRAVPSAGVLLEHTPWLLLMEAADTWILAT